MMLSRTSNVSRTAPLQPPTPPLLSQLIKAHAASVRSLLERLGVARGDSDDALQRVWLTVASALVRLHPGSERAFLFAVARSEAGHVRRTYRRRAEVTVAELDDVRSAVAHGEELVLRRERIKQAEAVLDAMDTRSRTVLLRFELGEESTHEIARSLGVPLGTVKSRLQRARAQALRGTGCDGREPPLGWTDIAILGGLRDAGEGRPSLPPPAATQTPRAARATSPRTSTKIDPDLPRDRTPPSARNPARPRLTAPHEAPRLSEP